MSSKRVIDRMAFNYIITKTSRKFDWTLRKLTRHTYQTYTLPLTLEHGHWKNPKAETTNNNNTSSKIDQEAKLKKYIAISKASLWRVFGKRHNP